MARKNILKKNISEPICLSLPKNVSLVEEFELVNKKISQLRKHEPQLLSLSRPSLQELIDSSPLGKSNLSPVIIPSHPSDPYLEKRSIQVSKKIEELESEE